MRKNLIPMAKIGTAHGIKGEVRIKPYGDPELLAGYRSLQDSSGTPFAISHARVQKGMLIAKFSGINDRDGAERLNGLELYVERSELPDTEDEEFYISDLIGMQIANEDGIVIGKVGSVPNYGAGDIIEVIPSSGEESFLLPFTREIFPEIDLDAGKLTMIPPAETSDREKEE